MAMSGCQSTPAEVDEADRPTAVQADDQAHHQTGDIPSEPSPPTDSAPDQPDPRSPDDPPIAPPTPDIPPDAPSDATPVTPPPAEPTEPRVLRPFPHILVNLTDRHVELDGFAILDVGFLEQVICTPGTREHESLVVTRARPSNIHAAMLIAGYTPGRPGRWVPDGDSYRVEPPEGDAIEILVRYVDAEGRTIEEPIRRWIRDHHGDNEFPDQPWIFGGSIIAENPEHMGPGTYYVADHSGSVAGLVTFGDEVIGFNEVISDQAALAAPEWEVHTERVPEPGTPVTVILKPASRHPAER